jgi:hypothetical protein
MNNEKIDNSQIKGWGIDADPKNDPTYPIQKRKEGPLKYERKGQKQQPITQEVLHSNERPNVSAVYGVGPEPSGLSGKLRRFAFEHGEGEFSHWIPLIFADRINAIEGVVDDLKNGKFPNIFVEKGWPAQWKYDRKGLIKKLTIYTGIMVGIIWLIVRKNDK